jgi:cadmium resistance protein CadD (predicted permease)
MIFIFKKLAEFFQDGNGMLSNTRLNSTMIILAGLLYPYLAGRLDSEVITYSFGLITLGMGGKLIQNVTEKKNDNAPKS